MDWLIFIPQDKFLHVVVSFVLALVDPILAVIAGIGKEIWDSLGNGVAEGADLIADAVGILMAVLLS